MIKLVDLLKEITINLNNSYPYNLSKNKNEYIANFITEDNYKYQYDGNVKNQILGINFEVTDRPGVKQDIEKTEKTINDVWLQIGINPSDHTKEFFNFETKKGILNTNDIKWKELWTPIKKSKTFINYIKSNFSSFNGKPIDLTYPSSYNINVLYISLENENIKGIKLTSGDQEVIVSFDEELKYIKLYYKLNLSKLDENLSSVIKSYIKTASERQHIGHYITTNKGNLFKIMNTIFQISKEIIDSNNKIKYIGFTPSLTNKDKGIDQAKRTKLYELYIKNIYPNSYRVTGEELNELPYSNYRILYKLV